MQPAWGRREHAGGLPRAAHQKSATGRVARCRLRSQRYGAVAGDCGSLAAVAAEAWAARVSWNWGRRHGSRRWRSRPTRATEPRCTCCAGRRPATSTSWSSCDMWRCLRPVMSRSPMHRQRAIRAISATASSWRCSTCQRRGRPPADADADSDRGDRIAPSHACPFPRVSCVMSAPSSCSTAVVAVATGRPSASARSRAPSMTARTSRAVRLISPAVASGGPARR